MNRLVSLSQNKLLRCALSVGLVSFLFAGVASAQVGGGIDGGGVDGGGVDGVDGGGVDGGGVDGGVVAGGGTCLLYTSPSPRDRG